MLLAAAGNFSSAVDFTILVKTASKYLQLPLFLMSLMLLNNSFSLVSVTILISAFLHTLWFLHFVKMYVICVKPQFSSNFGHGNDGHLLQC